MTRATVEVPAELVRPIRETVLLLYQATAESLHLALKARASGDDAVEEVHHHRARLDALDELVRRLEPEGRGVELSAPRDLLHDALYGALIDAGERLADTSNRCWRGELPLDRVQERAEEVLAIDALLRELSP
jgi:hypothetical protein